uniref:Uncharacterized protein n=1 Tax=Leersia perrieri TaxID=77586 RepID=A0A0D9UX87_9ORYZ
MGSGRRRLAAQDSGGKASFNGTRLALNRCSVAAASASSLQRRFEEDGAHVRRGVRSNVSPSPPLPGGGATSCGPARFTASSSTPVAAARRRRPWIWAASTRRRWTTTSRWRNWFVAGAAASAQCASTALHAATVAFTTAATFTLASNASTAA